MCWINSFTRRKFEYVGVPFNIEYKTLRVECYLQPLTLWDDVEKGMKVSRTLVNISTSQGDNVFIKTPLGVFIRLLEILLYALCVYRPQNWIL